MGKVTEVKTGVKCPNCKNEMLYTISLRDLPESKWAKQFLGDMEVYLEKLTCLCGTYVHYNNVMPNWNFFPSIEYEVWLMVQGVSKSFDMACLEVAKGIDDIISVFRM